AASVAQETFLRGIREAADLRGRPAFDAAPSPARGEGTLLAASVAQETFLRGMREAADLRGRPAFDAAKVAGARPGSGGGGMTGYFWAFVGISALVIMTPGPDTALTIRNTLLGRRIGGLCTALGVTLGLATWALATSVGVVALLVASEPVFTAVRLAGAAYLVYLGLQALRAAWRGEEV